eukprot:4971165-Alexandrium_andersonii.AAC.1
MPIALRIVHWTVLAAHDTVECVAILLHYYCTTASRCKAALRNPPGPPARPPGNNDCGRVTSQSTIRVAAHRPHPQHTQHNAMQGHPQPPRQPL